MPTSLHIAEFVLGAVLLLIALLGGQFKLFGAEVSGQASGRARVVAGAAGLLFFALGIASADGETKDAPTKSDEQARPQQPPNYATEVQVCTRTGASQITCDCFVGAMRARFGSATALEAKLNNSTATPDEIDYMTNQKQRCALQGALSSP